MRKFLAIYEKELKSYFVSPLAYAVISLFLVSSGILFYAYLADYQNQMLQEMMRSQQQFGTPRRIFNVNNWVIVPFFSYIIFVELMLIPLLTMRLYSDEKRRGTIELLLTSPITTIQTILGKYAAVFTLFAVMVLSTTVYMVILYIYGEPELGPILSGYLGLMLHGGALLALGMVISSMTENQIVAALATFVIIVILTLLNFFSTWAGADFGPVLSYLSVMEHFGDFAKGILSTKRMLFYGSFIFFGIYLTWRSVDSLKWR